MTGLRGLCSNVRAMFGLLPKENVFFELFEQAAKNVHEGALALEALLEDFRDVAEKARKVKDIEWSKNPPLLRSSNDPETGSFPRMPILVAWIASSEMPTTRTPLT